MDNSIVSADTTCGNGPEMMAHLGKPLLVIQIAPTLRGQTRGKLMMEIALRLELQHIIYTASSNKCLSFFNRIRKIRSGMNT